VDHSRDRERRADRVRAGSWSGSAETARCNLFLPTGLSAGGVAVPEAGLSSLVSPEAGLSSLARPEAALEGEPELARASLLEGGAVDRVDLGS